MIKIGLVLLLICLVFPAECKLRAMHHDQPDEKQKENKPLNGGKYRPNVPYTAKDGKDHLVSSLPGQPEEYTWPMYAGHVDVWEPRFMNNGSLFYWFFESMDDASKDPLIIWINGGPGCSSMDGMLSENGPFKVDPENPDNLFVNMYSWNKKANVLYIDQPVGTGMSVAAHDKYATNQTMVATMMGQFLKSWFSMFPSYKNRPLFFSGESYAGHYIPDFAWRIKEKEGIFQDLDGIVNLQGLMIGNGWTHPLIQTQTLPEFAYNNALIDWQQRHFLEKLSVRCGNAMRNDSSVNEGNAAPGAPKNKSQKDVENERSRRQARENEGVGSEKNIPGLHDFLHNNHYDHTTRYGHIHTAPLSVPECNDIFNSLLAASGSVEAGTINVYDVRLYGSPGTVWPPTQNMVTQYLNRHDVRQALHAYELFEWAECSGPVNRALKGDNMVATRPKLAKLMDEHHLRVLIYNGQFDLICNHVGTEAYLSTMQWKGLKEWSNSSRAVWNVDSKIAGYVKAAKELTFLIVLGGSHMVPLDQPKQAQDMIQRFIAKQSFADNPTEAQMPFTPTVPFIPGDNQDSDESDNQDDGLKNELPFKTLNPGHGDGKEADSSSSSIWGPNDRVKTDSNNRNGLSATTDSSFQSYSLQMFFLCTGIAVAYIMFNYYRRRSSYSSI